MVQAGELGDIGDSDEAAGPSGSHRVPVVLACSECKARNYKTTRSVDRVGHALELKKFCRQCGHHTLHRETK